VLLGPTTPKSGDASVAIVTEEFRDLLSTIGGAMSHMGALLAGQGCGRLTARVLAMLKAFLVPALVLAIGVIADAQSYSASSTDGSTPAGLQPGAPAGSYPLSGFENVELFGGGLNFHLPLVHVGGRGMAGYTMMFELDHKWRVERADFPTQCGQFGCTWNHSYFPEPNWWTSIRPGLSPGVLIARPSGVHPNSLPGGTLTYYTQTLTRFTFIAADGTEYELRDQMTNGQPLPNTSPTQGPSRGNVFVTADGTAATFISDQPVNDVPGPPSTQYYVSGYLFFRDGTRFRVDTNGRVAAIRDRNGNTVTFDYTYNGGTGILITDSLGRQVTVGGTSTVGFNGFNSQPRSIQISGTNLGSALRSGYSLTSLRNLFPSLDATGDSNFNPGVTSSVTLPDGRQYQFLYNSYAELAEVILPSGGRIEYDYAAGTDARVDQWGVTSVVDPDVPSAWGTTYRKGIYRRVVERRTYLTPTATTVESKTTYSSSGSPVGVDHLDRNGIVLAHEDHFITGDPLPSLSKEPNDYSIWTDGKEFKSEHDTADGMTVLVREEPTFAQTAPSWWTGSAATAPPNNAVVSDKKTTLVDTNQVSTEHLDYDPYNNLKNDRVYDFGAGAAGSLLRETHTDRITFNNNVRYDIVYIDPVTQQPDPNKTIHLRDLPYQTFVYDGNGTQRAKTTFEYDNYTPEPQGQPQNHAALTDRPGITGLDPAYTVSYTTRGNVTKSSAWISTGGTADAYHQYDIAGNTVKTIDPLGNATTADYSSTFQFAYPTKVTSPIPDLNGITGSSTSLITLTDYDPSTGKVVSETDANSQITTASYNDLLDRLKSVTKPDGGLTTYDYGDTAGNIFLKTTIKEDSSQNIVATKLFDGLGRLTATQTTESSMSTISTTQSYDGLGRVAQVSNPFRSGDTVVYTTRQYDPLGRMTGVIGPDGSAVNTYYSGNQTLVTDQAFVAGQPGKERVGQSDALGRLTNVWEITTHDIATVLVSFPGHTEVTDGYQTIYGYDALGDLTLVTQSSQSRTYTYDSLKRQIRAVTPESGYTAINYTYDNNGNLKTRADLRPLTVTYSYDTLNRITSRRYTDGTPPVSYTYDGVGVTGATNALGKLTTMVSSVSESDYTAYDTVGRVTGYTQKTGGQPYSSSYVYNFAGAMTSETYPSTRVVNTQYDQAGRISKVSSGTTNYESAFSYAAFGGVKSVALGNSLVEHSTYNTRLQPTFIGLGTSAQDSSVLSLAFDYGQANNNGNVQSQTIAFTGFSATQTYAYDALNRLSVAQENNGASWKQSFLYDRFGDRNVDAANTFPQSLVGPNPAIDPSTNRISDSQYSYDTVGNLKTEPGRVYSYDAESRLTNINSGTAIYGYDGAGQRVAKSVTGVGTTVFVYDVFGRLIAEYGGQATNGGTSYLTTDHLRSTRVVTDSQKNVRARHDFLPFGEELGTIGGRNAQGYGGSDDTKQRFNSKERDAESQLDYFNARYYSSAQGRFTSADTFPDPKVTHILLISMPMS
jgi:RHS repeat-associated protein